MLMPGKKYYVKFLLLCYNLNQEQIILSYSGSHVITIIVISASRLLLSDFIGPINSTL
jgi:hypothetical protein